MAKQGEYHAIRFERFSITICHGGNERIFNNASNNRRAQLCRAINNYNRRHLTNPARGFTIEVNPTGFLAEE